MTRGSHAIRIWAPCPPSPKRIAAWERAGSDPDSKPVTTWRLAAVFAQDQVGPPAQPAPLEAPIRDIEGVSHENLVGPLMDLAGELGYVVAFEATGRGDGYCLPQAGRIAVAERLSGNGRLAVLIHELGHLRQAGSSGCAPLTDSGQCYEPGEYCRDSDHGMSGVAGDGEAITCEDNNGWRWEPS